MNAMTLEELNTAQGGGNGFVVEGVSIGFGFGAVLGAFVIGTGGGVILVAAAGAAGYAVGSGINKLL